MAISFSKETVPLEKDPDGVIRVAKTRVTLDTVIGTFKNGATAEEIAHRYPTLGLADIYQTIAYYLRHSDDVEAYLEEQRQLAGQVRKEMEARFDPDGIRDRLLNRRTG